MNYRVLSFLFFLFSFSFARAGTFCIEPDGSQSRHQLNFYNSNDTWDWVPFGIVYSDWINKTECFDQNPAMNDNLDRSKAYDTYLGAWVGFIGPNNGSLTVVGGPHGYYRMIPNINGGEILVYQREYVYEFKGNPSFSGEKVSLYNKNDTGAQFSIIDFDLGGPLNSNYNGGVYDTNDIRLTDWQGYPVTLFVNDEVKTTLSPGIYTVLKYEKSEYYTCCSLLHLKEQ